MAVPVCSTHGTEEENSKEFRALYALVTKLQKENAALLARVAALEAIVTP